MEIKIKDKPLDECDYFELMDECKRLKLKFAGLKKGEIREILRKELSNPGESKDSTSEKKEVVKNEGVLTVVKKAKDNKEKTSKQKMSELPPIKKVKTEKKSSIPVFDVSKNKTVQDILKQKVEKHYKMYQLSLLDENFSNRQIAVLTNTNQGHVWNELNRYKNDPNRAKEYKK